MTIRARADMRRAQRRGMPLGGGGWNGWISDPSVIPPNSANFFGSTAGVVVSERTALSLMAVASCIRVLGDAIAEIEWRQYRLESGVKVYEDPLPILLDPYADIDETDGRFRAVASLALGGNLYEHVIDRDKRGNPSLIELLNPSRVSCKLVEGVRVYRAGGMSGPVIPTADLVHTPWIALAGGLVGLNPIEIGATSLGIALAANEYSSRWFGQGAHPTGVLSMKKPMLQPDMDRLRQKLLADHSGLSQSHVPIVLDADATWTQIGLSPEASQLLQSRSFSRSELAGFYGVPPHLIGDTADNGGPWGKGLQEMVMGLAMFTLSGYTRRLKRSRTKLLPPGHFADLPLNDLFKTNSEMLAKLIQAMRMMSVGTPNEARKIIGLPPTQEQGSDSIFAPINSAHADFLNPTGAGVVGVVDDSGEDTDDPDAAALAAATAAPDQ